jgi:hypothetical protein
MPSTRMKASIGTLAAVTLAVSGFAQRLTDDQVRQAIARGNGKRHQIGLTLNDKQTAFFSALRCQTCGQSGYTITIYNPEQWIELGAEQAKKEMQPFGLADVTDQMRAPALHVIALPSQAEHLTGSGIAGSSSVHRVVLSDTGRQITIQPLAVSLSTLQSNSALRSFEYTMASTEFSMSDVARLRDSDRKGEFFIVVVGDNQNKFFKVKSRDFRMLFPRVDRDRITNPNRSTSASTTDLGSAVAATSSTGVEPKGIDSSPPPTESASLALATGAASPKDAQSENASAIQSPPSVTETTSPANKTGSRGDALSSTQANATPPLSSTVERDASNPRPEPGPAGSKDAKPTTLQATASTAGESEARSISSSRQVEEALMGVSFAGSPTVRHDGIVVYSVQTQGPADNIDIQPGDVILAIDGHYLYTIEDLRAELLRHNSGARVAIRYRHYRLTSENYIILGSRGSDSQR